ncbi:D-alanyl-D-alanine carboxypeptidase family protein [Blautia sp. HCP3S3_G3]|uniref:D-alanyl-D-alanine carboxypeptidase family protein n=1 Tax=Blautia sp. HCP3S3_G3 TaxID=3438913 RepID=UPI003F8B7347
MAARKRKKKKRTSKTKMLLCLMVEIIVVLVLLVIIGWDYGVEDWLKEVTTPVVKELDVGGVNSSHVVLMSANGGKVIGEINGEEQIYPASLTKIMTVIVAIEELDDLEEKIMLDADIFPELYAGDATQAGFQAGEAVRAIDLLYGAILPSGAECCIGLADAIAGSEDAFVELMNKKAQKIGMENTHFCDTTGLHDPNHYSTAYDMAVLLKYAIRNDTFREIIETPRHSTGVTNIHPDGITYYSTMFKNLNDPTVTEGKILGGKTGYTNEAGLCLASFAEIGGREYILVTAGAPGNTGEPLHVQDAVTIYNRLGEAAQALTDKNA